MVLSAWIQPLPLQPPGFSVKCQFSSMSRKFPRPETFGRFPWEAPFHPSPDFREAFAENLWRFYRLRQPPWRLRYRPVPRFSSCSVPALCLRGFRHVFHSCLWAATGLKDLPLAVSLLSVSSTRPIDHRCRMQQHQPNSQ